MKKILITGKNSYVGNSFKKWVEKHYEDECCIDLISLKDEQWLESDFKNYDVILHVAGIAHTTAKKNMENTYYQINTDLAIKVAEKAKSEGVKQFIFMSSMIVFGDANTINYITSETVPNPVGFYGNSKLKAEKNLSKMETDLFKVVIIRSPMIYGENSKGNFHLLSKLVGFIPLFPMHFNQRSMIHIDNLTEFIYLLIKNNNQGIFHPQNKEYISTYKMVKRIAYYKGKKLFGIPILSFFMKLLIKKSVIFNKVFGDFVYDKELSNYEENYCVNNFEKSIELTIK